MANPNTFSIDLVSQLYALLLQAFSASAQYALNTGVHVCIHDCVVIILVLAMPCLMHLQHTHRGDITMRVIICDMIPLRGITSPLPDDVDSVTTLAPVHGVRFEVWDSGSGLGGVDPDLLFEPFSQGTLSFSPFVTITGSHVQSFFREYFEN